MGPELNRPVGVLGGSSHQSRSDTPTTSTGMDHKFRRRVAVVTPGRKVEISGNPALIVGDEEVFGALMGEFTQDLLAYRGDTVRVLRQFDETPDGVLLVG